MSSSTATVDNVNTSVQKVKTLVQTATTAIGSAHSSGSGNPIMLVGTTINVCANPFDEHALCSTSLVQNVMSAVNKAHSVSTDKSGVIVVIKILEYVLALEKRYELY